MQSERTSLNQHSIGGVQAWQSFASGLAIRVSGGGFAPQREGAFLPGSADSIGKFGGHGTGRKGKGAQKSGKKASDGRFILRFVFGSFFGSVYLTQGQLNEFTTSEE
jgi:hypothetical protein